MVRCRSAIVAYGAYFLVHEKRGRIVFSPENLAHRALVFAPTPRDSPNARRASRHHTSCRTRACSLRPRERESRSWSPLSERAESKRESQDASSSAPKTEKHDFGGAAVERTEGVGVVLSIDALGDFEGPRAELLGLGDGLGGLLGPTPLHVVHAALRQEPREQVQVVREKRVLRRAGGFA